MFTGNSNITNHREDAQSVIFQLYIGNNYFQLVIKNKRKHILKKIIYEISNLSSTPVI